MGLSEITQQSHDSLRYSDLLEAMEAQSSVLDVLILKFMCTCNVGYSYDGTGYLQRTKDMRGRQETEWSVISSPRFSSSCMKSMSDFSTLVILNIYVL